MLSRLAISWCRLDTVVIFMSTGTILMQVLIAPGDVYVVAHPSADATILAEADETLHPYLSNGDDGYGLVYGVPSRCNRSYYCPEVMLIAALLVIGMEIQVLDGKLQE